MLGSVCDRWFPLSATEVCACTYQTMDMLVNLRLCHERQTDLALSDVRPSMNALHESE